MKIYYQKSMDSEPKVIKNIGHIEVIDSMHPLICMTRDGKELMILIDRINAIREDDENMKCAVCGNEIKAECFVEQECLEKLIKERDRWEELAQIGAQNCQFDCEERKELERLKAENESLKQKLGDKK